MEKRESVCSEYFPVLAFCSLVWLWQFRGMPFRTGFTVHVLWIFCFHLLYRKRNICGRISKWLKCLGFTDRCFCVWREDAIFGEIAAYVCVRVHRHTPASVWVCVSWLTWVGVNFKTHVLVVMLLRRKKGKEFEERFSEIYRAAFIISLTHWRLVEWMTETCHIKYLKIWYRLPGWLAHFPCEAESLRGYCINILYDYVAEKYSTDGRKRYISVLFVMHGGRNILSLCLSHTHTHSHTQ